MNHTLRQRSQLVRAAERGLRREQPVRVGRIALAIVALVVLWGVVA